MEHLIYILTKYMVVILMALYVYFSFSALRNVSPKKLKGYNLKQSALMYTIHALCFLSVYLHTYEDKIIIFYGATLLYMLLLSEFCKFIYKNYSVTLINITKMMLCIGFIMLTRLSFDKALKQFIICVMGTIIAMFIPCIMSRFKKLREFSYIFAIIGIFALGLVYTIGSFTYGAKLSLDFHLFTIQPSEFVKISFVFAISGILYKNNSFKGILISGIMAGLHVLILVLSSDLGTALIFCIVYIFLVFMATGKYIYLAGGLAIGSAASVIAYRLFSHVKVRVAAWLDPWSIIDDKGFQIAQSLFAIGTGGLFGLGLYEGMPNTIPVVEQDFIFSAICEEFGSLFSICLIFLSLCMFFVFIKIAFRSSEPFYKLVCSGFGILLGIQLFLTIGGAIKLIPSTGVTYPLISYGGSSMVSTLIMIFIVQGVKINE